MGELAPDNRRAGPYVAVREKTGTRMTDRDLADRAQRHPEKAHRADAPILKKPDWIRVKAPTSEGYRKTREIMR